MQKTVSLTVNGKPASEPIKEPELFDALMKIVS